MEKNSEAQLRQGRLPAALCAPLGGPAIAGSAVREIRAASEKQCNCRTFPHSWGLAPAQDRILARLVQKGRASKKVIAFIACPTGMGSVRAVKAQISLLRSALARAGVAVTLNSIRGWGYELDAQGRARLQCFVEAQREKANDR